MKVALTVAIADDHETMRKITEFRVSRLGYQVVMEAENGQHLIDQLHTGAMPDICLLDINMPVMNGFETLSWLKTHRPGMKVLVLSMHNEAAYVTKALQLGADGYITKDASLKELNRALQELTDNTTIELTT